MSPAVKTFARKYIFPTLVACRLERLSRVWSNKKVLNLFYHGVVAKDSTHILTRHLQRDQFEAHLKYIKNQFNVISLQEAFVLSREGLRPDRATVTLSFDDGYQNNFVEALPLLEKHGLPCTFFISSILLENPDHLMWPDVLAFSRYFEKKDYLTIDGIHFTKTDRYELFSPEHQLSASNYIKSMRPADRTKVLRSLISRYDLMNRRESLPAETWKLMTKDQLSELDNSGYVTIGSHTHLHYNLAEIPQENTRSELLHSKTLLEDAIDKSVCLVSYPDGSYNESVKALAKETGYDGQLAVGYRCPDDKDDPAILPRYCVSSTTTTESNLCNINLAFNKVGFC